MTRAELKPNQAKTNERALYGYPDFIPPAREGGTALFGEGIPLGMAGPDVTPWRCKWRGIWCLMVSVHREKQSQSLTLIEALELRDQLDRALKLVASKVKAGRPDADLSAEIQAVVARIEQIPERRKYT